MEQLAADFVGSDSDAELQQVDLNCGGSTFTTLVDDDVVQDGRQRHGMQRNEGASPAACSATQALPT